MLEWMLMPYRRYFDFSGRSRPKEYWMFALFVNLVYIGLIVLAGVFSPRLDPATGELTGGTLGNVFSLLFLLFMLGSIIPGIATAVRRCHDSDKSGWFILVPIYGIILMFVSGTNGPNRFGPDPLQSDANTDAFT